MSADVRLSDDKRQPSLVPEREVMNMAALVVVACVAMLIGWSLASQATLGVAFICSACVFAILARLVQAADQQRQLIQAMRGASTAAGAIFTSAAPPTSVPQAEHAVLVPGPVPPIVKVFIGALVLGLAIAVTVSLMTEKGSAADAVTINDTPHFKVGTIEGGRRIVNMTSKRWERCWAWENGRRALLPVLTANGKVTLASHAFSSWPAAPPSPTFAIACDINGTERQAQLE